MHIYLTHRSALECWRLLRKGGEPYVATLLTEYERLRTPERPSISETEAIRLSTKLGLSLPICIESPPDCKRHNTACCQFKRRRGFLENDSMFEIDDEILVPSPEATLLQMAESLDSIDLARLGMELSASYVLKSPTSQIISTAPLLDVQKATELAQGSGTTAARKALCVLPHVYPGCESPAEISMAAKLLLPTRWGGLGLEGASINPILQLSKEAQKIAERKTCRPDMLFAEVKLDLEYDGAEWHSTPDQLISDMKRWHALRREGFRVINVNARTLRDPELMTELAKEIRRAQGKSLRIRTSNFKEKQLELFRRLANPSQLV